MLAHPVEEVPTVEPVDHRVVGDMPEIGVQVGPRREDHLVREHPVEPQRHIGLALLVVDEDGLLLPVGIGDLLPRTARSQGGVQMRSGLMGFASRLMGEHENFMRAYPPVNGNFQVAKDLFEGI